MALFPLSVTPLVHGKDHLLIEHILLPALVYQNTNMTVKDITEVHPSVGTGLVVASTRAVFGGDRMACNNILFLIVLSFLGQSTGTSDY